jgi:hypothetical protein
MMRLLLVLAVFLCVGCDRTAADPQLAAIDAKYIADGTKERDEAIKLMTGYRASLAEKITALRVTDDPEPLRKEMDGVDQFLAELSARPYADPRLNAEALATGQVGRIHVGDEWQGATAIVKEVVADRGLFARIEGTDTTIWIDGASGRLGQKILLEKPFLVTEKRTYDTGGACFYLKPYTPPDQRKIK